MILNIEKGQGIHVPHCLDNNICYSNELEGRSCDGFIAPYGYDDLNTMKWISLKNKPYLFVKEKVTHKEASLFCQSIGAKLFEPSDQSQTIDGIALKAKEQKMYSLHIGVNYINDNHLQTFYYITNPESTNFLNETSFITRFTHFDIALLGEGVFPFVLNTGTNVRVYNSWIAINHESQHGFVCEKDEDLSNHEVCYLYGVEYEMLNSVKVTNGIHNAKDCQSLCQQSMYCSYWKHEDISNDCFTSMHVRYITKNKNFISGPKYCLDESAIQNQNGRTYLQCFKSRHSLEVMQTWAV